MIIGCCGSGKSTLAAKLSSLMQLELIHLDKHYWKENWVETEKDEWKARVMALAGKDPWIMDGNYNGTMDIRMARADTIIFLDFPTLTCVSRVLKRTWFYYGKSRQDMPPGCPERFSLKFLWYVLTFNQVKRLMILDKLLCHAKNKKLITLKNDDEVRSFMQRSAQFLSV